MSDWDEAAAIKKFNEAVIKNKNAKRTMPPKSEIYAKPIDFSGFPQLDPKLNQMVDEIITAVNETKICIKCNEPKPLIDFRKYKGGNGKYYTGNICLPCRNEYHREYNREYRARKKSESQTTK